MPISIVIARYNEDLSWLKMKLFNKHNYNIIIYNKGQNDNFYQNNPNIKAIIRIPNIGRCDHTYLYHIIENYEQLDDIVVFLPGSCSDRRFKFNIMCAMMHTIQSKQVAVFPVSEAHTDLKQKLYNFTLDSWSASDQQNFKLNNETVLAKASIRPFGSWFDAFFPGIRLSVIQCGGIFSIAKSDILQRSIEFYQRLLSEFKTDSNPEAGHYMERSYAAVFSPMHGTILLHKNDMLLVEQQRRLKQNARKFHPHLNPALTF